MNVLATSSFVFNVQVWCLRPFTVSGSPLSLLDKYIIIWTLRQIRWSRRECCVDSTAVPWFASVRLRRMSCTICTITVLILPLFISKKTNCFTSLQYCYPADPSSSLTGSTHERLLQLVGEKEKPIGPLSCNPSSCVQDAASRASYQDPWRQE